MKRAYLSPSKLEVYRKFIQNAPYSSQQDVISTIRGDRTWKPALDLGVGFHLALDRGPEAYWDPFYDAYVIRSRQLAYPQVFSAEQMAWVQRYRKRYHRMVHECSMKWHAETLSGTPFTINMRLDGVEGLEVHEHKTTSREIFVDDYEKSLQWRIYLAASGGQVCQYNIFRFLVPELGHQSPIEAMVVRYYPYPFMQEEIIDWVQSYLEFVERHQLQEFVYQ